jgi:Cu+-exporting ATPase
MTTAGMTTAGTRARVELAIEGMTCGSCAHRIERRLGRLDGVDATVNFATEIARVDYPAALDPAVLVAQVEAAGYTARLPRPPAPDPLAPDPPAPDPGPDALGDLRRRLIVSAVLALPVVALSMVPAWQFRSWQWIALALAAPVVVWGAWPVHATAARLARRGEASMDTLVSLGTLAALGWSLYALVFGTAGAPGMTHPFTLTVGPGGTDAIYLEVAAGVTVFILLGRSIEARSKRRAGAAVRALLDLGAKEVAVLRGSDDNDTGEVRVPVGELAVGERFVVRPGETIAADGVVVEGRSAVDASMLTGEAIPVEVGPSDAVTGGCRNASGRLVVRAERVGTDTQLARMARLVAEAQSGKAAVQRLADRVSGVFVPIVIALAVATLGFWLGAGASPATAVTTAVAVLIIACPCALGLATPTALLAGTGRGAQLGILIKGPEVLESTRRVDTVVLDKTGTVTTGEMTVHGVHPAAGVDADLALRLAGAVEAASEHPIGRAVAAAAGPALPGVAEFDSTPGAGVRGVVAEVIDGSVLAHAVLVGRPELLAEHGIELPADLVTARDGIEANGHTAVAVAWDGVARAVIAVGDTVRPTSAAAVRGLRALGLRPMLLTGDNGAAARVVAQQLGIAPDAVIAEVRPEGKVDVVRRLQAEGRVVAMVGDGVNDAAALAAADLGLAMGSGSDAAIEAGDLTLVRGDLLAVVDAIGLARRTLAVIKGNLFWAFAYNVAALPLAALGLLNPMIAGAAMAFSSVFVVTNSLRLRRFRSSA